MPKYAEYTGNGQNMLFAQKMSKYGFAHGSTHFAWKSVVMSYDYEIPCTLY